MKPQHSPRSMTEHPSVRHGSVRRFQGHWLLAARVTWGAIVAWALALFVISLPAYYQLLQLPCIIGTTACQVNGALTEAGMHALQAFGFSPSGYAAYTLTLNIVMVVVCSAVGFVIFWRRSDEWMALLVALMLILFDTVAQPAAPTALLIAQPAWTIPVQTMNLLSELCFGLFFYLFPTGRFEPRWVRWFALYYTLNTALQIFLPTDSPLNGLFWSDWMTGLSVLFIVLSVIFSQVYRYRRMTSPTERQQVKWAVSGLVVSLGGVLGTYLFSAFAAPVLHLPDSFFELATTTLIFLIFLPIPLSLAFAILRYRLWEIDLLIRRTLIYGTLTLILALVYFGLIFALQFLFQGIFYQKNAVVIVVSTLAIAALFHPLRRRIQAMIDRRFYRRKYDAQKTLDAFSATLRQEVDLEQLREELVAVVQETMQPTHVSLWLRPPEPASNKQTTWSSTPPVTQDGEVQ